MKLEYPLQIFEKQSNVKFHENRSSGSRVDPCGQTDRHDEAVTCRNFAKAPVNGVRVDCIQRAEDKVSGTSCKHGN
jgi:hypothetical protein